MSEARRRVLGMLAAGKVSVTEAERLLDALKEPAEPREGGRLLRILVKGGEGEEVKVNLPLSLARVALEFLPAEHRALLRKEGVDLDALLSGLKGELPEGRLVEVKSPEGDEVVIEVV